MISDIRAAPSHCFRARKPMATRHVCLKRQERLFNSSKEVPVRRMRCEGFLGVRRCFFCVFGRGPRVGEVEHEKWNMGVASN